MGTFLGAMFGAILLILIGRKMKGRDFMGLAVAMFILGLLAGAVISPLMVIGEIGATMEVVEAGDMTAEEAAAAMSGTGTAVIAIVAFLVTFVPGILFVLVASPTDKRSG